MGVIYGYKSSRKVRLSKAGKPNKKKVVKIKKSIKTIQLLKQLQ